MRYKYIIMWKGERVDEADTLKEAQEKAEVCRYHHGGPVTIIRRG
jgi:hypothetical protein